MKLYLVRHAGVAVRPALPSAHWHLSPEGRAAADALPDVTRPGGGEHIAVWLGLSALAIAIGGAAIAWRFARG